MLLFGVLLSCIVIIAGVMILVLGRREWKFNSQLLFISVAMVLVELLQLCYWVVRNNAKLTIPIVQNDQNHLNLKKFVAP
jgi:hypothetical protein